MRQSQLFTKTRKEDIKKEKSINAKLLVRAGFVDKLMAGVYTFLPLGLRVLNKIGNIIREEMNEIGGQEILMPALHPRKNWETTKRWKIEEMFKTKNQEGKDFGLGWTHEEVITPLTKKFVKSYKNLPLYIYQIQDKFRDELRAKSGLLRGREFLMKDLYSFHENEEDLDKYYEKAKEAYFKIFKRVGLLKNTYLTLASGGTFSKYSHEFQTVTQAGEDTIYICKKCKLAINKEIKTNIPSCPKCKSEDFNQEKTIEVGNIFKLGNKYSRAFNLSFKDKNGSDNLVLMGCYGIGLSRLMAAIVEIYHDKEGILWPEEVSPFKFHLISIFCGKSNIDSKIKKTSDKVYEILNKNGQNSETSVLYDDRKEISGGEKLAENDLIGISKRLVISEKTLKKNCVEFKERKNKEIKLIKIDKINTL
ncbi:MAG: His/Gly/Thr/Pro-type tRNA ligase C-terminal domain-containing protein [Candidatus Pacebacteria bacterium]|nr:His/Gly/Thr/Pro-type tRNA ligase C-terminal domain-containing protein [Candidatus Paceibacterota bacterium]